MYIHIKQSYVREASDAVFVDFEGDVDGSRARRVVEALGNGTPLAVVKIGSFASQGFKYFSAKSLSKFCG